jgi:hypothetical protein
VRFETEGPKKAARLRNPVLRPLSLSVSGKQQGLAGVARRQLQPERISREKKMFSTISKMAAVVAMGFVLSSVALADDASPNTPNTPNKGKVSKMQSQGQTQTQSQTQVKGDSKGSGDTQISKGSGDTQISKGSGSPVVTKGDKQSQGQAQTQSQSQTQSPVVEKGKGDAPSKVSKGSGEPIVNNKAGKLDKTSKKSDN